MELFGFESSTLDPALLKFQYKPLKDGELRLLHILSGDTLGCELVHFVLHDSPIYYGLSYTWGNAEAYGNISINGTTLPVAHNLWMALHSVGKHVRQQGAYLWVDAICINQSDIRERNSQVLLMREIYANAATVVIWLGEHSDDSEVAMSKMIELTAHLIGKLSFQSNDETALVNLSLISHVTPEDPTFYGQPGSPCHQAWEAIAKLLRRPWFTRAWIVQEVTGQNERIICCGNRWVKWADLVMTSFIAHELALHPSVQINPGKFNWFTVLDMFRSWRRTKTQCLLLNLCGELRPYKSTDPRDKIYAVAGMASDLSFGSLSPDYAKPVEDVYIDFAAASLANSLPHHKLDFLGFVLKSSGDSNSSTEFPSTLPSWVPDWRAKTNIFPFHHRRINIRDDQYLGRVYSASKDTLFDGSIYKKELHVKGFVIDVIASLSALSEVRDNSKLSALADVGENLKRETYEKLINGWSPQHPNSFYTSSKTMEEAFLTTITADTIDGSNHVVPIRPHMFDWNAIGLEESCFENQNLSVYASDVIESMRKATYARRFMWSEKGRMGLAPAAAQVGDRVCVLFGGQVLYILSTSEDAKWEFIGECYVHGLMDGEALDQDGKYQDNMVDFVLI